MTVHDDQVDAAKELKQKATYVWELIELKRSQPLIEKTLTEIKELAHQIGLSFNPDSEDVIGEAESP
jgi:hypothetical protein